MQCSAVDCSAVQCSAVVGRSVSRIIIIMRLLLDWIGLACVFWIDYTVRTVRIKNAMLCDAAQ